MKPIHFFMFPHRDQRTNNHQNMDTTSAIDSLFLTLGLHSNVLVLIDQMCASFPAFMNIDPSELLAGIQPNGHLQQLSGTMPPWEDTERMPLRILCLVCMHGGLRHTDFLLKRALVNRGKADPKELIPPARKLIRLILQTLAKKDFFRDFQIDLVCLLAFHGLPSAGVLAIELLKQEQSRVYTPEILPRSETIQDLSVFISALAAVGPGEGNHAICNQGRRALKRLLDKILSPGPIVREAARPQGNNVGVGAIQGSGQQQQQEQHQEQQMQADFNGHAGPGMAADLSGLYFPTGNDAEFLQWLEDVEWDRGSWLNPV